MEKSIAFRNHFLISPIKGRLLKCSFKFDTVQKNLNITKIAFSTQKLAKGVNDVLTSSDCHCHYQFCALKIFPQARALTYSICLSCNSGVETYLT